jgi:hypothetical protein
MPNSIKHEIFTNFENLNSHIIDKNTNKTKSKLNVTDFSLDIKVKEIKEQLNLQISEGSIYCYSVGRLYLHEYVTSGNSTVLNIIEITPRDTNFNNYYVKKYSTICKTGSYTLLFKPYSNGIYIAINDYTEEKIYLYNLNSNSNLTLPLILPFSQNSTAVNQLILSDDEITLYIVKNTEIIETNLQSQTSYTIPGSFTSGFAAHIKHGNYIYLLTSVNFGYIVFDTSDYSFTSFKSIDANSGFGNNLLLGAYYDNQYVTNVSQSGSCFYLLDVYNKNILATKLTADNAVFSSKPVLAPNNFMYTISGNKIIEFNPRNKLSYDITDSNINNNICLASILLTNGNILYLIKDRTDNKNKFVYLNRTAPNVAKDNILLLN